MKYIFETAAKTPPPDTHPYISTIYIPKTKNGWTDNDKSFKTAESWLEHLRRRFLILGITDVICIARDPIQSNNEAHRFSFCFTNAAQCYQFQAATVLNTKGNFTRKIEAKTTTESLHQEANIARFLEENGIEHGLSRRNSRELVITTSCKQDDLIIAMHIANKVFDLPTGVSTQRNKGALLLRSNEKV